LVHKLYDYDHKTYLMDNKERVRSNTSAENNAKIELAILNNIRYYSHNKNEIPERLAELDAEWDIERTLELNAAVLALAGTVLAAVHNKKWLLLPALVTGFLTQHATQGWCPPLPLLRSLGIRTRQEIDAEKVALKALLGEFKNTKTTREIWQAASH
jgi:hypothetical protein